MSHDVRPSLNCRTHERTFFPSITPSLHVSLNCRWISIGFMPRKGRNRIITRCSSNVNVAIWVSKTLLQLDLVTSIERVVQCCHLASPNLKNNHVFSNNFHVSICFHSPRKKLGDLRTWTPHVHCIHVKELLHFHTPVLQMCSFYRRIRVTYSHVDISKSRTFTNFSDM